MVKSYNSDGYGDEYLKTKINCDDDLPLEKTLAMSNVVILIRSTFNDKNKYYLQLF